MSMSRPPTRCWGSTHRPCGAASEPPARPRRRIAQRAPAPPAQDDTVSLVAAEDRVVRGGERRGPAGAERTPARRYFALLLANSTRSPSARCRSSTLRSIAHVVADSIAARNSCSCCMTPFLSQNLRVAATGPTTRWLPSRLYLARKLLHPA